MKKHDVTLGTIYTVKVSGRIARVRIDVENPHGGWDGTNLGTNRKVRIKTAARLRGVAPERSGRKRIVTLAEHEAELAAREDQATEASPPAAERDTGQPRATGGRTSLLDAAAVVLADAEAPLGCKEIVERALQAGHWAPSRQGKTPDRTLTAAILREIKLKGPESRFQRIERGRYALSG